MMQMLENEKSTNDWIIHFLDLSAEMGDAFRRMDRDVLAKYVDMPLAHHWESDFGAFDKEQEFLLNGILIHHIERKKSLVHTRDGHVRIDLPKSFNILVNQLFDSNSDFWDDFFIRRRLNTIWSGRLDDKTVFSAAEFVKAMEFVYSPWFVFIDALFHQSSENNTKTSQALTVSSRMFFAGYHCLIMDPTEDHFLKGLVKHSSYSQGNKSLSHWAKSFFSEALALSSELRCSQFQKLILTKIKACN